MTVEQSDVIEFFGASRDLAYKNQLPEPWLNRRCHKSAVAM
ncbi:MAG: hypothetical protein P0119_10810 [Nitrospira sp.]|nr:hypothetical protein [Nitrospira sp.]